MAGRLTGEGGGGWLWGGGGVVLSKLTDSNPQQLLDPEERKGVCSCVRVPLPVCACGRLE